MAPGNVGYVGNVGDVGDLRHGCQHTERMVASAHSASNLQNIFVKILYILGYVTSSGLLCIKEWKRFLKSHSLKFSLKIIQANLYSEI